MPTTSDLRRWWAPHCTGPWARLSLYGTGVVTVRAATVDAFLALDACLRKWNYQTERHHTGAYNCRRITGGTGYSLHAYGIAVDINWQDNPYGRRLITDMPPGMVADIEALRTGNGKRVFRWGGRYSGNKDAMHYEIFCSPADLATGIRGSTTPLPKPEPPAQEDEPVAYLIRNNEQGSAGYGGVWAIEGLFRQAVSAADYTRWQFITGGPDAIRQLDAGTYDFFMRNFVEVKNVNVAVLQNMGLANAIAEVSQQIASISGAGSDVDVNAIVTQVADEFAARLAN